MIGGGYNETSEDLMNYNMNLLSETSDEPIVNKYLERKVNKLLKRINKKLRKY